VIGCDAGRCENSVAKEGINMELVLFLELVAWLAKLIIVLP